MHMRRMINGNRKLSEFEARIIKIFLFSSFCFLLLLFVFSFLYRHLRTQLLNSKIDKAVPKTFQTSSNMKIDMKLFVIIARYYAYY